MKKLTITGMIYAVAWALLLTPSLVRAQTVTPTFESIGIDWKIGVDKNSRCKVAFKRTNESDWHEGLDLFTDLAKDEPSKEGFDFVLPETEGFRGSIVLLEPGTAYDIKLTYTIKGGPEQTKRLSATTWNENFPIDGEVITVTSRTDLQNKLDALKKRKNRPTGKYVVFKGNGKNKIDGGSMDQAIKIDGLSYVILRDLDIFGATSSGIWISESNHIVVENCKIHDWGKAGTWCQDVPGKERGKDAAIYAQSSSHLVVQRNTISNPRGNSCYWPQYNKHPTGPRGICLTNWAKGTSAGVTKSVFRYNKIFSSEKGRYFSDVFNAESGGADSDIDVYGNEFANAWDDGIEIEGNNKNIRVWGNVIRNVLNGVASDRVGGKKRENFATYYGPVYIWRNIITNLQAGPADRGNGQKGPGGEDWEGGAFKIDNRKGQGGIYLFNNTISGLAGQNNQDRFIRPKRGVANTGQHNLVVKNNIFEIKNATVYNDGMMPSSRLDYNAYSNARSNYKPQLGRTNWEKNGQFNVNFTYQKGSKEWDYYAQDNGNSKAQNAGTRVPNFIETPDGKAPNLGAAQKDVWSMCVGLNGSRECSGGTHNPPPPPVTTLPEPAIAPIEAAYVPAGFLPTGYSDGTYWASAPTYQFTHPAGSNASDNQVTVKALWNEQYLLVGVVVKDGEAVVNPADATSPWNNDGIELLLDVKNNNASTWDTLQGHKQIIVDFAGHQHLDPTDWKEVEVVRGETTAQHPGHNYVIRVPWSSLGVNPQDKPTIGIDIANNDREEGKAKTQFTYTKRTTVFKVPGRFAKLILGKQSALRATLITSPIILDGKLDEAAWQAGEVLSYPFGPNPLAQAVARLLWDADNLYVSFSVTDLSLVADANPDKPWQNDGVELLLDIANNNASSWDALQGHRQVIVDAKGNMYREPDTLTTKVGKTVNTSGLLKSYVVEMSIPWTSLGVSPQAGKVMGIELVNNDRLGDGTVKGRTITGRTNGPGVSFKLPSAFADLVLVGNANARNGLDEKFAVVTPEAPARQLVIYPNPASQGAVQLQLTGFETEGQLQITDLRGNMLYQGQYRSPLISLSLNFPSGVYIVRVTDAQGILARKLLVK